MTEPTLATLFGFDGGHPTEHQLEVVGAKSAQATDRTKLSGAPSAAFWGSVAGAVSRALDQALHVKVSDLLAGGWNTLHKLLEAGDRSRSAPGEVFGVPLARHTVTSSHHPSVELLVGGRKVAEVPFEVELELEIESAILTVQDAKIKDVAIGKCTVKGTLTCAGAPLVEKKTEEVTLPGKIKFGDGFSIPRLSLG